MYAALARRDASYEGIFVVAVRTTGIFCRPVCTARTPNRENVTFFAAARDALSAGYRPCRKCRPLEAFGSMPDWCRRIADAAEADLSQRWSDSDLRAAGVQPERIRRWFNQHLGMTFQAFLRARRMSLAMGRMNHGQNVTTAALDSGYSSPSGFRDAFRKWLGQPPRNSIRSGRETLLVNRILTELGPMLVVASDAGLHLLEFADRRMLKAQFARLESRVGQSIVVGDHGLMEETSRQLGEYFSGSRRRFDLPLALAGTDFQLAVWRRLLGIGYGETVGYEQLAREIGHPGAQRAVGRANGDNRLAVVVPCHRVIRSDGSVSGYGGGVWRKQRMLELERAVQAVSPGNSAARSRVPAVSN